jgi:hypothetical protein
MPNEQCRCQSPNHGHVGRCDKLATEADGHCKPCHELGEQEAFNAKVWGTERTGKP